MPEDKGEKIARSIPRTIPRTVTEVFPQQKNADIPIEDLVAERGTTHGNFSDHARITQQLKLIIKQELIQRQKRGQVPLNFQHVEALDMIMHKVGRIIAGDPAFQDHWDDIGGYAKIATRKFS